jgi:hypothetical protein
MSDLPAPLTPADCDLRGFEWMAIHGHRLFTSGWYSAAIKDPRGGLAALKLWWAAMLQCPAGSLPNDEDDLCLLADFGQDAKSWRKHRAVAMRGFVLCSDNRYYHPVVAEQAIKAFEKRLKATATRHADAERLRRWRATNGSHPPEKPNGQAPPETPHETPSETRFTNRFRPPGETRFETPDETRLTVQDKTEPVQEERKEVYSNSLISPVLARVAAACETPPEGSYGSELSPSALQLATKTVVEKLGRKLNANANGSVSPQGKRPKLTVVQQQDAVLRGPVIDDDTLVGELLPPIRRGPVDPQRTVAEQLAALGFPHQAVNA